ncbi:hypothetical protein A2U01_0112719, partial [Trifolium medium]|nr:hypothetical protein [Trifolium medium]
LRLEWGGNFLCSPHQTLSFLFGVSSLPCAHSCNAGCRAPLNSHPVRGAEELAWTSLTGWDVGQCN